MQRTDWPSSIFWGAGRLAAPFANRGADLYHFATARGADDRHCDRQRGNRRIGGGHLLGCRVLATHVGRFVISTPQTNPVICRNFPDGSGLRHGDAGRLHSVRGDDIGYAIRIWTNSDYRRCPIPLCSRCSAGQGSFRDIPAQSWRGRARPSLAAMVLRLWCKYWPSAPASSCSVK